VATAADVAVVFVRDRAIEGAERADLSLPDGQDALIRAVAAANPRTIVVLMTGGPVTMPWLQDVPAVVEAWYPGQEGGSALADVLFGDTNPAGRLPVTFPAHLADAPASGDPSRYPGVAGHVRYGEGIFVGYRHYERSGIRPLFPFGHGLSYTRFEYRNLSVTPSQRTARSTGTTTVSVTVQNVGPVAGAEVLQLYVAKPSSAALPQPKKELVGFAKVFLEPGQRATVRLAVPARAFSSWDAVADRWIRPVGSHRLMVGASSSDIRLWGAVRIAP
jgi:beta-glucosidase